VKFSNLEATKKEISVQNYSGNYTYMGMGQSSEEIPRTGTLQDSWGKKNQIEEWKEIYHTLQIKLNVYSLTFLILKK
jgi:hypothetical protein